AFRDGSPPGKRTLPGRVEVDPQEVQNLANCGRETACSETDMDRVTSDRPWGPNNPRWQLYGHGRLALLASSLVGRPLGDRYYIVLMVADDPGENDDDPTTDGVRPDNPGAGVLALRVEAFGPRGIHRRIDGTVGRSGRGGMGNGLQILSWHEFR